MNIAIYTHKDCFGHDTGLSHPECAQRLQVILDELKACDFAEKLCFIDAPTAKDEDILLAHAPAYLQYIYSLQAVDKLIYIDNDTVFSKGSLNAALRAVGAGCKAVDDILQGKYQSAFCVVRPPGHHATKNEAMGFCIFNNIAIAALYAVKLYNLKRIAIIDFDVHHGNGSEDILLSHKQVLYISTHQTPLFPGTGMTGKENIINIPLSYGTDGKQYREIFEQLVLRPINKFKPELILVSAGFDAHLDDPLAGIGLVEADYNWLGQQIKQIADKYALGKVISFLEGGYNLQVLGKSVVSYLRPFAGL